MPNWVNFAPDTAWGNAISVKQNAAERLEGVLHDFSEGKRSSLRIFMASTTDPYQPIEAKYKITQSCLQVFARVPDLDLLVLQTRSPLALRDLDLVQQIPYLWFSVTIETDDQKIASQLGGGPTVQKRFDMVRCASKLGIATQIVVSPCLPYTPEFTQKLLTSGAQRIVVDNFVAGDGSNGRRTSNSRFATECWFNWRDTTRSTQLYQSLLERNANVSWSAAGFCGIPKRHPRQLALF